MPIQHSPSNSTVRYADGCIVAVSDDGDTYSDVGLIKGNVTFKKAAESFQLNTNAGGKLNLVHKNPTVELSFELYNYNLDVMYLLSSGLATKVEDAGGANSSIPNQTISGTWEDYKRYNLNMFTSSSDNTPVNMSTTKPTITSVTIDAGGVNEEVLDEGSDYFLVKELSSPSGWAIVFNESSISGSATYTDDITIVYGTNTGVAGTTLHFGSSITELSRLYFKIYHTDANSKVFRITINESYVQPEVAMDLLGSAENEANSIPFSFLGVCDSESPDGRQLYSIYKETGAL